MSKAIPGPQPVRRVLALVLDAAQMASDVPAKELLDIAEAAATTGDLAELEAVVDDANSEAWRVARQRLLRELFAEDWLRVEHG